MEFADFLRCPVCASSLLREGGSLLCTGARRHCYDVASAGYVNLLPPGKKNNAHTGDDGAMIAARTLFLSGGAYDAISDAAADVCFAHMTAGDTPFRILDAGSGEGYHTCRIARRVMEQSGRPVIACGVDASKKGAAAGARLAKNASCGADISFVTGNIFALPAADHMLDVVLSLFAPIPAEECIRTLKEDGILCVVAAGPRHLWELRCLLYDEPREGNEYVETPDGFICTEKREVRYMAHIPDQAHLDALFTMTPFYYRTPVAGRQRLAVTGSLTVSVEADIYVFVKAPSASSEERNVDSV